MILKTVTICTRYLAKFYIVSFLLLTSLAVTTVAVAALTGNCSDCHTMHYSQGGQALAEWGSDGPYNALLTTTCVSCHTGVNSAGGDIPFVFSTTAPVYDATGTESGTNTLAGGNFYWVANGTDDTGHNVDGLAVYDSLANESGFLVFSAAADSSTPGNGSWPAGKQVTCAGTYGCHGTHSESVMVSAIVGGHHYGQSGALTTPGTTPAGGFRMLIGIAGYEDPEWELTPTSSLHNQYKGVDDVTSASATISALCMRCHDDYHASSGSGGGWLRHPIDYDMGSTAAGSEVRGYGGTYDPAVPVASIDVSSVVTTVTFNDDTIVTCLSCHRSHGSPFSGLLRWDYKDSIGNGKVTGGGCTACHTSKN